MIKLKIENGKLKTKIFASFATLALVLGLGSCEQLQDSLSTEQEAKLLEETGTPTLADKVWYYNGVAGDDVSGDSGFLKIDFGQQVAEGANGISGNFLIEYTDKSSENVMTVQKKLEGGLIAGESYYLDMNPVLEMLDGKTVSKGTMNVSLKVSGLVCASGKQKGRSVNALESKISVKPLYEKVSNLKFLNTKSQWVIPLNGVSELSDDASVSIGNIKGDDSQVPSSVSCEIAGLSEDKKSILVDVSGVSETSVFTALLSISGIRPLISGTVYSQLFSITVKGATAISPISAEFTDTVFGTTADAAKEVFSVDEFAGLSVDSIEKFTIEISSENGTWDNVCIATDGSWVDNVAMSGTESNRSGTLTWEVSVAEQKSNIEKILSNGLFLFTDAKALSISVSWE